jgi:hypothetical protein
MKITVTKHAIRKYRERLFDFSSSDKQIICTLKEIASKGIQNKSKAQFYRKLLGNYV